MHIRPATKKNIKALWIGLLSTGIFMLVSLTANAQLNQDSSVKNMAAAMAPYNEPKLHTWAISSKAKYKVTNDQEPEDEYLRVSSTGLQDEGEVLRMAIAAIDNAAQSEAGTNLAVVVVEDETLHKLVEYVKTIEFKNRNLTQVTIVQVDTRGRATASVTINRRYPAGGGKNNKPQAKVDKAATETEKSATEKAVDPKDSVVDSGSDSTQPPPASDTTEEVKSEEPKSDAAVDNSAKEPAAPPEKRSWKEGISDIMREPLRLPSFVLHEMLSNKISTVAVFLSFIAPDGMASQIVSFAKAGHVEAAIGVSVISGFMALTAISPSVWSAFTYYLNEKFQNIKVKIGVRKPPANIRDLHEDTWVEHKNIYSKMAVRFLFSFVGKAMIYGTLLHYLHQGDPSFFTGADGVRLTDPQMFKHIAYMTLLVSGVWTVVNFAWEQVAEPFEKLRGSLSDKIPSGTFWFRRLFDVRNFAVGGILASVVTSLSPAAIKTLTFGSMVASIPGVAAVLSVGIGAIGIHMLFKLENRPPPPGFLKKYPKLLIADLIQAPRKIAELSIELWSTMSRKLNGAAIKAANSLEKAARREIKENPGSAAVLRCDAIFR